MLSGLELGDSVNLDGSPTYTFTSSDVGLDININTTGYILTGIDAGNYSIVGPNVSSAITAKPLSITGLIGSDKVYDGTTTAEVIGTGILSGLELGDSVILEDSTFFYFSTSGVGTDLDITSSGFSLSGSDAGNYILTPPTLSASITAKPLSIAGLIGLDKVYDGTTTAGISGTAMLSGLELGDSVILEDSTFFHFAISGVGTDLELTSSGYSLSGSDAGNYILTPPTMTAAITAKPLSITGLVGSDKVYDGTTTVIVGGSAVLAGLESGDDVNLDGSPTYTLATSDVGSDININTTGYILTGIDAGNYSIVRPNVSAAITAQELTITGLSAQPKIFDSTATAVVTGTPILEGIKGSDDVILEGIPIFTFASSEVGTGIAVNTIGYVLGGVDAGNYSLVQPILLQDITVSLGIVSGQIADQIVLFSDPYSGLVNADLRSIENPSLRVMNPVGQVIQRQSQLTSSWHEFELQGPVGLYVIEITDKVGQTARFPVFKSR